MTQMRMMIHEKKIKMKKLMTLIKEFLFGRTAEPVCHIKLGFTTVYPANQPDEWEWKQEFRFGMLHGRKPIHLD